MTTLNIYVCENFYPEYKALVDKPEFEDIHLIAYPSLCMNKGNKIKVKDIFEPDIENCDGGMILCSKYCEALNLIPDNFGFQARTSNYCFHHLAGEGFINYILEKGGYIVGLGWLKNWRREIDACGFNQENARKFYHEFAKELVFFDAGIDENAGHDLFDLSQFLDLPYVIIPIDIECIKMILQDSVNIWKLNLHNREQKEMLNSTLAQCAEYSAVLDLMSKIAVYVEKDDAINKIKETFFTLFGVRCFKYWDTDSNIGDIPESIQRIMLDMDKSYDISIEKHWFIVKIEKDKKVYGILECEDFMFPQYIEKYLNFAIEISKICGLIFSNIDEYQKVVVAEEEMRYIGYHDSLTDLFNRTYISNMSNHKIKHKRIALFMFDIDHLKFTNDNYGHEAGDRLIVNVSNILKHCFRESDILARIGGDEFVAIVTGTNAVMAEAIETRIEHEIQKFNKNIQDNEHRVSVSFGFAVSETEEITIQDLMKLADQLMYENKAAKCAKD